MQLLNPAEGVITSFFGNRINPITKLKEEHKGLDIANDAGSKIVAVADCVITEIYNSPTFGNTVKYKLKNNENVTILYAHNDKILVNVGDEIEKGDVISTMGNTGRTTGVHLHYAVYVDNEEVNPLQYVNLPYTREAFNEYVSNEN